MDGKSYKILVIEDNPGDYELLVEKISEVSYFHAQLEWADLLTKGLSRLEVGNIDLVLLDLLLPDSYGLPTLHEVQAIAPQTPIILLTGMMDEEIALQAVSAGAQDYLSKDKIDGELLARTIRYAIERQAQEQALKQLNIELEKRVEARTAELVEANEKLHQEVIERRETEEKFRQLAENIRQVFYLKTIAEDQTLYISPAYKEIWGESSQQDEIEPDHWLKAIHSEDYERILIAFRKRIATKQPFKEEYRIVRQDGSMRWVSERTFPIRNEEGEIYRLVGIIEDITEYKKVETEIRKALAKEKELNELQNRFVTNVSHEFRTPLTKILSSAELLENYGSKMSEEKINLHFQRIYSSVNYIERLIEDIFVIDEIESGRLEFQPTLLDLNSICRDLIKEWQIAAGKQYQLIFNNQDYSPQVRMDFKLVRLILGNILENAIKYSPNGGMVELKFAFELGKSAFQITDQGIGIPQEDLPNIFKNFYRASNVGTIRGNGLGLAIAKHCVNMHQGRINVESILGSGTTVKVILPIKS